MLPERPAAPEFAVTNAIFWAAASAAFLGLVAVVNGYPLLFADSGTYIRQGFSPGDVLHRPPFYGMFVRLIHFKASLWPVPFVQNAVVCYIMFRVLPLAIPGIRPSRIALAIGLSCALTTLPWHSNQIMPDINTPLIVLLVFALALERERLSGRERAALAALLCTMITFHLANATLAAFLLGPALWMAWRNGCPPRGLLNRAWLVAAPVAIALIGQTAHSYSVTGRLTPSSYTPFFLLARLVGDGPAKKYLAGACPGAQYVLCRNQEKLGSDVAFLWSGDSPLSTLFLERGTTGAMDEANAIVRGAVMAYPGEVFWTAVANTARQFARAATYEPSCPNSCEYLDAGMAELFPWELSAYQGSLQIRRAWPLAAMTRVHGYVFVLASALLVVWALARSRPLTGGAGRLVALIAWACIANAALTGALSGLNLRYQSRIAWLIPFVAFAILLGPRAAPGSAVEGFSEAQTPDSSSGLPARRGQNTTRQAVSGRNQGSRQTGMLG